MVVRVVVEDLLELIWRSGDRSLLHLLAVWWDDTDGDPSWGEDAHLTGTAAAEATVLEHESGAVSSLLGDSEPLENLGLEIRG